jgi:rhodanese-related sulfurtransferase
MTQSDFRGPARPAEEGLARGVVTIVLVGVALGVTFNWLGLASRPAWGLPWIGVDRLAALESLEDVAPAVETTAPADAYTRIDDPMAVGLGGEVGDLPGIPELDRPVEIELAAVKQLFDAGAALFIDARGREEFEAGHIAGSLSMPFDEVTSEPERMEQLMTGGMPIVTYCGGGLCEDSLGLAWELLAAGQTRVVVYVGGYAEWTEAGHPVAEGPPPGS